MEDLELGELIDKQRMRDAVHVAVAPVFANCELNPGQHVGLVAGSTDIVSVSEKPIGIVDPFLKSNVLKGQRFWLWIYPNTIMSLRHVWSHPSFVLPEEREVHVAWITAFARLLGHDYEDLMDYADKWIARGEYHNDELETHKSHYDEFAEFWRRYELVTGTKVDHKECFFSCSC